MKEMVICNNMPLLRFQCQVLLFFLVNNTVNMTLSESTQLIKSFSFHIPALGEDPDLYQAEATSNRICINDMLSDLHCMTFSITQLLD